LIEFHGLNTIYNTYSYTGVIFIIKNEYIDGTLVVYSYAATINAAFSNGDYIYAREIKP
jgi:hypothetical protein